MEMEKNEKNCQLHQTYCKGLFITRESVYGAVLEMCNAGWDEIFLKHKNSERLWPEILEEHFEGVVA